MTPAIRGWPSASLYEAIASSFAGGRFEIGEVGLRGKGRTFEQPDLCSAYMLGVYRLPCLAEGHGRWTYYRGKDVHARVERACTAPDGRPCGAAIVRARVPVSRDACAVWADLFHRDDKGRVSWPRSHDGGWYHAAEYLAAKRRSPHVTAIEAFIYERACDHRPFDFVPHYYRERVRLGSDGAGLVFKTGLASIYGKLCQTQGSPQFQSWVWAGMVTAGTRAQIIDAIACAKDPRDVVSVATDGLVLRKRLDLPRPEDTGTFGLVGPSGPNGKPGKPKGGLGEWEYKVPNRERFPDGDRRGLFFCRPGIVFPPGATVDDLKELRGRGIGRRDVLKHADAIIAHYERETGGRPSDLVPVYKLSVRRFVGAKTGTLESRGWYKRRALYGEWIDHPIEMSFGAQPKRARVREDGTLALWERRGQPGESMPYGKALLALEGSERARRLVERQAPAELERLEDEAIADEQPPDDFGFGDDAA